MTTEIIEGNKVIAEFDGWIQLPDYVNGDNEIFPYYMKEVNGRKEFIHYHPEYHSSWDWLMPVYKKYLEIRKGNDIKWTDEQHWQWPKIKAGIAIALQLGDIEKFWERLIEFITWHKTQTNG